MGLALHTLSERKVLQVSPKQQYTCRHMAVLTSFKTTIAANVLFYQEIVRKKIYIKQVYQRLPIHHSLEQNLWQNFCRPGL